MNRTDVAIVINTCPAYFYLLEAHFGLLRRYGAECNWPVYLATECWNKESLVVLCNKYNVKILKLDHADYDFFESRVAAMKLLPSAIQYVLPLQEDFLLERPGLNYDALEHALKVFDEEENVVSIRLMPCPGVPDSHSSYGLWKKMTPVDQLFSYQATLWRKTIYRDYIHRIIDYSNELYPELSSSTKSWNEYAIRTNPAETHIGLTLLKLMNPHAVHLCWPRKSVWANAVYHCPWPYRPTAVVRGTLEPWAEEMIRREGFYLNKNLWL